jgi:hypothetical protein
MSRTSWTISDEQRDQLKKQGYLIFPQAIDPLMAKVFSDYALMQRFNKYYLEDAETRSMWKYADVFGESLLLHLKPLMESAAGCSLFPTNSVLRIYQKGSVLKKHFDRGTCEYSATLTAGYDSAEPYPIWLEIDNKEVPVYLEPGDVLIYKGCEVAHWRNGFGGRHWIQLFLHYVDQNGKYSKYKYDGRLMIGMNQGKILS